MKTPSFNNPGPVILLGSGETSSSGQKVFDFLFRSLTATPRVAILETPAGFELNSALVADRIANFLTHNLQNYNPQVEVIPARRRGSAFSPDDPCLLEPILLADVIFMGPGSPTYAARQLAGSLAWEYVRARHLMGAALVLASAAAIAVSQFTLPVYEIYKAGEDPHWKPGLDLFGACGLPLAIVTHWNNNDGGAELDTSRCFIGRERFDQLLRQLPPGTSVAGIDERTALWIDLQKESCRVLGQGEITLQRFGHSKVFQTGEFFSIQELGELCLPKGDQDIQPRTWERIKEIQEQQPDEPPEIVVHLAQRREAARTRKDWAEADALRQEIATHGWIVQDTPNGLHLIKKS